MERTTAPLSLGVIGAGQVGRAIGGYWARAGHRVLFGTRDPRTLGDTAAALGAEAVPVARAAEESQVVLLAVPYDAVEEITAALRPALAGKIVIDATNPMAVSADGRIVSGLPDRTAGDRMASLLPDSVVVRAFNHVIVEALVSRAFGVPLRAGMALAGDDPAAKETVADLVRDAGFDPVDIGGLADSGPLDPGGTLFAGLYTAGDIRARIADAGLATSVAG
jgi:8-hydroxy-5-deazaflavin:NADPH oxidoreductase